MWWSLSGSNRLPSRCKRDALPNELKPHILFHFNSTFQFQVVGHLFIGAQDQIRTDEISGCNGTY